MNEVIKIVDNLNDVDYEYGGEDYVITDADIELLKQGKIFNFDVNWEYGCTLRYEPTEDGKWIPVSERLPEEMGTYMTTIDYGEHGLVTGQRYYYGRGLKWNDECVIAWMPLPEPYKESEDKE